MSDYLSPGAAVRNWFPIGRNNDLGWHLDIVSLLAVIGESAMEIHAQRTTVSWLCVLPRLIPAPQGLLKADRAKRLPPVASVKVVGAYSATKVEELNFAANLIHNIRDLQPHEFQEWVIAYDKDYELQSPKGLQAQNVSPNKIEEGPPSSATNDIRSPEGGSTYLVANRFSPANILTVLSFLGTVGIFIWAYIDHDGVAALAVGLLSLASSLTGLASKWTPKLDKRTASAKVPEGDLVLRTRSGAFVVVHCNEHIARELYTGSDECDYFFGANVARFMKGFATLFLMVSVVLLGNCSWSMQAVIGAAYLILNGAYWLASLLSENWFWHLRGSKAFDMRPFEIRKDAKEASISRASRLLPATWLPHDLRTSTQSYIGVKVGAKENEVTYPVMSHKLARAHVDEQKVASDDDLHSYARTLWYAILRSGSTLWVAPGEAAPDTPWWKKWIEESSNHIGDEGWLAIGYKNELLLEAQEAQKQKAAQRTRTDSSVATGILQSASTLNGTVASPAQAQRPNGLAPANPEAALPSENPEIELTDYTTPGASRFSL
ncbi:hypothetical protein MBLNU457_6646t1 [Dothideomycetes sp. NU457]